jgi:hypothetical protein
VEGAEFRRILEQVTEELLSRMRRSGFYYEGVLRYDPLVWDINNGRCEEWASLAADRIPDSFPVWMDEQHCVLAYNGRFYDADCIDGEDDYQDLPMFARWYEDRPQPLGEENGKRDHPHRRRDLRGSDACTEGVVRGRG